MVYALSSTARTALAFKLALPNPDIKGFYGKVDAAIKAGELSAEELALVGQYLESNQHTELVSLMKEKEREAFFEHIAFTVTGFVLSCLATVVWVYGLCCVGFSWFPLLLGWFVATLTRCNTVRVQGKPPAHAQQPSDLGSSPGVMWVLAGGYFILMALHYFEGPLAWLVWLVWVPLTILVKAFLAPILAYLTPAYEYLRARANSVAQWVSGLGQSQPSATPPPPPNTTAGNDSCAGQNGTLSLCHLTTLFGGWGGVEGFNQTLRYLLAAALVVNASYVMVDAQTGEHLALPAHAPLPSLAEQRERIQFHRRPGMGFEQDDMKTKFQRAAEEKQAQDEKKPVDAGKGAYDWYVNMGYTLGVSVLGNIGVRVGKYAFDLGMAWAVRRAPQLGAYAPYVRILVAAVPGLAVQQLGETSLGWHTLGAMCTSGAVWQSFAYIGEWIVKQWGGEAAVESVKTGADGNPPLNPAGAAAQARAAAGGAHA